MELSDVREQLRVLQAEMMSRVENTPAVSDEHLAQEFHSLVALVRVLGRSTRTSKETNVLDVLKPRGFLIDIPGHHWEARAVKKTYIEAWIWSVLIDEIFGVPFSIFGEPGEVLERNWSYIFCKDDLEGWPYPTSSSENWRHLTTKGLLELSNWDIVTKGLADPKAMKTKSSKGLSLHHDILEKRKNVENILGANLLAVYAAADLTHVSKIINKACSLALNMSLSPSRIMVTYARTGAQFDGKKMSTRDIDDESLDNRTVAFVIRP